MLVFGQKTYVPDDNFEIWLEANGYGDGDVQNDSVVTVLIENIQNLPLANKGIEDITGIEDMTWLRNVDLGSNNLTTADFSSNRNIVYFFLYDNDSLSNVILPEEELIVF